MEIYLIFTIKGALFPFTCRTQSTLMTSRRWAVFHSSLAAKTDFCLSISAPYNCKTTTLTMNSKLGEHGGAKDNYAKKNF